MAPSAMILGKRNAVYPRRLEGDPGSWRDNTTIEAFIVESWSQGFMVGALLIMACVTISNMRAGIFLHKLILLELFLAMSHGTFCFMSFDGYGWYLSATAALLYLSWIVHNLVAWLKIRPFLTVRASRIFIGTLSLTLGPIILQIVNNFRFFNNIDDLYVKVRAYEVLVRDPWWVFACILFFYVIKTRYTLSIRELIVGHPRFAIMLVAMAFSIIFTIVDVLSSIIPSLTAVDGINPYWKVALVFKALTDVIILDDFKTCLERLQVKLVEQQTVVLPKPPPVPPKDYHTKGKTSTIACTTAKSSPTLVSGQSPKGSPGKATTQNRVEAQVQRTKSVRSTISRIGTRLSPLPTMDQMQDDFSPSEKSPNSGGTHMIHVKMDLGLNKFVSSVVGLRPPSIPMESPLDPTWPRLAGLRRGLSIRSNGALSSNARSSRSSVPTLPERTPTLHGSMPNSGARISQASTSQRSLSRPSTSHASTSHASTSQASTSQASTSQASTSQASTSRASTSQASTSQASTSQASTSQASTSRASTSQASTSQASTSQASTSQASTSQASTPRASMPTSQRSLSNSQEIMLSPQVT